MLRGLGRKWNGSRLPSYLSVAGSSILKGKDVRRVVALNPWGFLPLAKVSAFSKRQSVLTCDKHSTTASSNTVCAAGSYMYPAGRNDPSEIFESNQVSDIAKIRGWICWHRWVNSDRFGNGLLALKYRMKADFLLSVWIQVWFPCCPFLFSFSY